MNEEQKKLIKNALENCVRDQKRTIDSIEYYRKDIKKSELEILNLEKKYKELLIKENKLKESL